jgi:hypothetical protein
MSEGNLGIMAIQKRMKVAHEDVFPAGAFLKGAVEPVMDFNAPQLADGSRHQQVDKETGLLVWQATVLDADEDAGKRDTAVTVKFLGKVRPVPPENKSGFPWTPVKFVGLTVLAWVDESGSRPRVAWSYRAEDLVEPDNPARGSGQSSQSGSGPKAA